MINWQRAKPARAGDHELFRLFLFRGHSLLDTLIRLNDDYH
jgi:hypothetical protein